MCVLFVGCCIEMFVIVVRGLLCAVSCAMVLVSYVLRVCLVCVLCGVCGVCCADRVVVVVLVLLLLCVDR